MNNTNLDPLIERHWYTGFCNDNEIDRILSPMCAKDFLLQKRANIVADHARFQRVYLNKARMTKNWSFEKSFSEVHYQDVLRHLSPDDFVACKDITFGDMFSNDVNGYAWKEPAWGRIISLNESLQFFMKFCNLALMDFEKEVPQNIRFNSLRIAIRVLLKVEAMDFFMDPRGIVPQSIGKKIHFPIRHELQFIAGHEFCHHVCGHLNDKNITQKSILTINNKEYSAPVYSVSQMQEFEADIASLQRPLYSTEEFSNLLYGALLWFISLDLGELAKDMICPSFGIKTHPTAKERIDNILDKVDIPSDFNLKVIDAHLEKAKLLRDFLTDDISTNFEFYEFYGSAYLDAPNTKWRGRELIDRVDY